jgi:hypothetical protein
VTTTQQRVKIDCRRFPSEQNCTLTIAGTEDEVIAAAHQHAVSSHGHEDSPELKSALRSALEPATD